MSDRSTNPAKRRPPDESPNLRPVTLRPPELVDLNPEHERQALDALAELVADHLDRHARREGASRA